eukprot:TRINITY_DN22169_c0_g1_i2.p1 TRINITY_DN22169_c0_g1~~TRINITY_DN22169_c0_g1_i2.p1  ORF type:complete len:344 (-),score=16.27 TRINITY_DN22169_c0_g1_i2:92-1060(-)
MVCLPLLLVAAIITWLEVQASRTHVSRSKHSDGQLQYSAQDDARVLPAGGKGKIVQAPAHGDRNMVQKPSPGKGNMLHVAQGKGKGKGNGEGRGLTGIGWLDALLKQLTLLDPSEDDVNQMYAERFNVKPNGPKPDAYRMTMNGVVPGMAPGALPRVRDVQPGMTKPCHPPAGDERKEVLHCTSNVFGGLAYHSSVMVGRDELAFNFAGVWLNCGAVSHGAQRHHCRSVGFTSQTALQAKYATINRFRPGSYDMLRKNCNSYATVAIAWLTGYEVEPRYRAIEGVGQMVNFSGALFQRNPSADEFSLDRAVAWAQRDRARRR